MNYFFHCLLLPLRWFITLRFLFRKNYIREKLPEMWPEGPTGYTDKSFYYPGETVFFYLRSSSEFRVTLERISGNYSYEPVQSWSLGPLDKEVPEDCSENGCRWRKDLEFTIPEDFPAGYYRVLLKDSEEKTSFITFLIGNRDRQKIVILAPVSTWTAYNPFGGKSAYRNFRDKRNIHFLSVLRPNTALQYREDGFNIHDINVEANIFNWFCSRYNAGIYPDYYLEKYPALFDEADIIVLSYHCEYVSSAMYKTLRKLFNKGISLISLGGNQLFWKIRWKEEYTRMEIRKDHSFFQNSLFRGNLWRYTLFPEYEFLGAGFSDEGMGTFAPYEVLMPEHWLFEGAALEKGDLFGFRGINDLAISGDETDKVITGNKKNVEVVARGRNPERTGHFLRYNPSDGSWNGEGGGVISVKYGKKGSAILCTGSIQSGSGLGKDSVLTLIIERFTKRYLARN